MISAFEKFVFSTTMEIDDKTVLHKLNFIPFSQLLKNKYSLDLQVKNVFVKDNKEIEIFEKIKICSNSEMLTRAIKMSNQKNVISQGYSKVSNKFYQTNTTLNILKTHRWSEIFDKLGTHNSIYLLTNSFIVERINKKLIFICGNFDEITEKYEITKTIDRNRLFYSKEELNIFEVDTVINTLIEGVNVDFEEGKQAIRRVLLKYNKLPVKSIFKSFFSKKINESGHNHEANKKVTFSPHNDDKKNKENEIPDIIPEYQKVDIHSNNVISNDIKNKIPTITPEYHQKVDIDSNNVISNDIKVEEVPNTCQKDIKYSNSYANSSILSIENGFSDIFDESEKKETTSNSSVTFDNFSSPDLQEDKRSIMEYRIEPERIVGFLFLISKKFLRPVLNMRDFRILKGKLTLLLKRNRFETLSHNEIFNHFKTGKSKIFNSPGTRIIFEKFFLFLFDKIFMNLLTFFFYSTTTCFSKSKVFYFSRIEWNKISNEHLNDYLEKYEKMEIKNNEIKPVATLRCIPKENGLRVILNCKNKKAVKRGPNDTHMNNKYVRKTTQVGNHMDDDNITANMKSSNIKYDKNIDIRLDKNIEAGFEKNMINEIAQPNLNNQTRVTKYPQEEFLNSSINSLLIPIFHIIKRESTKKLGFSLFSPRNLKLNFNNKQKIYIAKIDLQNCFENIVKEEIIKILETILDREIYFYDEISVMGLNKERETIRSSPDFLKPISDYEEPKTLKSKLMDSNNLILKENKFKIFYKAEIIKKIKEFLQNMPVYYQGRHYRSVNGIPQGCCLSSLLCALYFGDLDSNFRKLNCRIFRYVDDFLILSEDKFEIIEFLNISKKLQSKGMLINYKKTSFNFEVDLRSINPNMDMDYVPSVNTSILEWCGIQLYDDLSIKPINNTDYIRYTVYCSHIKPVKHFLKRIQKIFNNKSHFLFINKHNPKNYQNIYDLFYYIGRITKIFFMRLDFINREFIFELTKDFVTRMGEITKKRKMKIHFTIIEKIANDAYKKSGIFTFEKREFR